MVCLYSLNFGVYTATFIWACDTDVIWHLLFDMHNFNSMGSANFMFKQMSGPLSEPSLALGSTQSQQSSMLPNKCLRTTYILKCCICCLWLPKRPTNIIVTSSISWIVLNSKKLYSCAPHLNYCRFYLHPLQQSIQTTCYFLFISLIKWY